MKLGVRKPGGCLSVLLLTTCALSAFGQAAPGSGSTPQPAAPVQQGQAPQPQKEAPLTHAQAKELFRSVNEILQFASDDSKLAIQRKVKRRLITRRQVEKYIEDRFHEDKDAKRMQREEVVLKKFGLLDRDFQLQPFLVSLLTEQIAAFYDNKTKTVNLLDWVPPDDQKPVIAHELTHALQDQYTDLDKFEPEIPQGMSKTVAEDNGRLASDEEDTARDAVLEGQAMAVYVDYTVKPEGKSLLTLPDVSSNLDAANSDSPVMARAPIFLQESLLFPYRDGLGFEQTLLKDKGPRYAFAGVLDHPPSSSYEIMNPEVYERKETVPLLRMPDVHSLLDPEYEPYDVGVMGEIDVHTLVEILGGADVAEALSPEWNGGIYYAVQSRSAKTPQEKASTASIRLLYLSSWRSPGAAKEFAGVYAQGLSRKYSNVDRDRSSESTPDERVFRTSEGPVLIAREDNQVFISESFDLDLARKLEFLYLGAQQSKGSEEAAQMVGPFDDPAWEIGRIAASCGVMKAALRQVYLKP